MKLPDLPVPDWYWKLPLKWRQRYCKIVANPWMKAVRFCDKWISTDGFKTFVGMVRFKIYCKRADIADWIEERNPGFLYKRHRKLWMAIQYWPHW